MSTKIAAPAVLGIFCLLLPLAGSADVRIGWSDTGRKVIFNEAPEQRARRFSASLVAVPDVSLEPLINRHSDRQNLDPRLVKAVIQVESGYNRNARSNKGAKGLMQLMPETAVELAVHNPYDADENLRGGTAYLRQLLDRFAGRLELAVAAYNAGPGAVERHHGVPPFAETRDYVQHVLALYRGEGAAIQMIAGHRPKPYVYRNGSNRLVLTTSLAGLP
ncbi:MAG TPA: lytic transglycosylase domain-containing protein [Thermoanaerobaculia bacterium]